MQQKWGRCQTQRCQKDLHKRRSDLRAARTRLQWKGSASNRTWFQCRGLSALLPNREHTEEHGSCMSPLGENAVLSCIPMHPCGCFLSHVHGCNMFNAIAQMSVSPVVLSRSPSGVPTEVEYLVSFISVESAVNSLGTQSKSLQTNQFSSHWTWMDFGMWIISVDAPKRKPCWRIVEPDSPTWRNLSQLCVHFYLPASSGEWTAQQNQNSLQESDKYVFWLNCVNVLSHKWPS